MLTGVARDTVRLLKRSEASVLAGSLAFGTVMSIVPLLAVSLGVFHAYGGFQPLFKRIEPFLLEHLVSGAGSEVRDAIHGALRRIHSKTLGVGGAAGLLIASTKLFLDIETAVQKIWSLRVKRPLWLRLFVYWAIMFAGPLLLAVFLGVVSSYGFGLLAVFPKGTVGFVFAFFALAAIFKLVPACKVRYRAAGWSAVLTATAVIVAQVFYAVVTKKILAYNKIYGGIAAIPIFLLWLLVLWWIILAGVAICRCINARIEKRPVFD